MKAQKSFDTPILFIVFNRPDTTREVFSIIKKVRPSKLFIAADGPRKNKPGEEEKCNETRKITEEIDWPCKVKRLYREKNLGCKYAVSGAIDWFFNNVEEGIILEDDCLPNLSFFEFCESMLNLYKNNTGIMCISGDNFLPTNLQDKKIYYISRYGNTWGWATWKRAWKKYDINMSAWTKVKNMDSFNNIFKSFTERLYWHVLFDATYRGNIDTWDYQRLFSCWNNGGMSINPGVNLVKNIGFSDERTHINTNAKLVIDNNRNIENKPKFVGTIFSDKADSYLIKHIFRISIRMAIMQFIYLNFLKRIL